MGMTFKIEGMKQLKKSLKKLGEVPQKHVTASARKGMNVVLKDAKRNAPMLSGDLKRGIISVGERSGYKGKKVYRLVFDRKMNSIFQKTSTKGKKSYYPISQEYGFKTRSGGYIPGFKFTRNALTSNTAAVQSTIIKTMQEKIDKEIANGGLK